MVDYMTKFLLTKTGLNIIHTKCETFRQMISKKSPDRQDLIDSFEISKKECIDAMLFMEEIDREYRLLMQRSADLELACMKLSQENAQLRLTAKGLIDRVNI